MTEVRGGIICTFFTARVITFYIQVVLTFNERQDKYVLGDFSFVVLSRLINVYRNNRHDNLILIALWFGILVHGKEVQCCLNRFLIGFMYLFKWFNLVHLF